MDMNNDVSQAQWVAPANPSFEHFRRVGRVLFACLAGGIVAKWSYHRREQSETAVR
jgi:hypothetical protein